MSRWLLKSEPDEFGYDDLVRVKREGWDGVRNYQARNFIRQFDPDAKYHDPKSDPGDPRWDWVTVAPDRRLEFVSLDELKGIPALPDCASVARGNRLSVIPLTDAEFEAIVGFADAKRTAARAAERAAT